MSDTGRTAVVTGASSGIGKEAAKALVGQGWHVIAIGRSPERSAAAEQEIRAASSGAKVTMLVADLSLLATAARISRDIAALTDRVHVLLNNAGGMSTGMIMTTEGFEQNFAGNHLGFDSSCAHGFDLRCAAQIARRTPNEIPACPLVLNRRIDGPNQLLVQKAEKCDGWIPDWARLQS